jgi:hypothetical protein
LASIQEANPFKSLEMRRQLKFHSQGVGYTIDKVEGDHYANRVQVFSPRECGSHGGKVGRSD